MESENRLSYGVLFAYGMDGKKRLSSICEELQSISGGTVAFQRDMGCRMGDHHAHAMMLKGPPEAMLRIAHECEQWPRNNSNLVGTKFAFFPQIMFRSYHDSIQRHDITLRIHAEDFANLQIVLMRIADDLELEGVEHNGRIKTEVFRDGEEAIPVFHGRYAFSIPGAIDKFDSDPSYIDDRNKLAHNLAHAIMGSEALENRIGLLIVNETRYIPKS